LLAIIAVFVIFSLGLGVLAQYLLARFHIPLDAPAWLALLVVFGILGLVNLSGLPLPIGVSIMLIAAEHWNPVLIALAGSLGASLGEFTSYFFGYLGERLSINEDTPGYKLVQSWIRKYGMWAIAFLSFQPLIPFELGGFIAGLAKMPVRKFLPAIWLGKFPKYLLLVYLGSEIIRLIPFIHL
jgi:uncharacterized membrane protein YdjX (TVP38/TMEM64 family)